MGSALTVGDVLGDIDLVGDMLLVGEEVGTNPFPFPLDGAPFPLDWLADIESVKSDKKRCLESESE